MYEKWMRRAMMLAEKGRGWVHPNPLVGAVILQEDRVLGEGYHRRYGMKHAEREALDAAAESVRGATMIVTLEPCSHFGKTPPCADAIIAAGIAKVVVGLADPNPLVSGRGIKRLRDAGIEVVVGVEEKALRHQNRLFLSAMEKERPRICLKAGMSLDGRIATRTGQSQWITGEKARVRVHKMRHQWPSILVGVGTILADNPSLTARPQGPHVHQPLRIVLDSAARTPVDARVITAEGGGTLICVGEHAHAAKVRGLEEAGAQVMRLPLFADGIDLFALMASLARRGIDGVLVEGGSRVHGAFLDAGLVDEVALFVAPLLIGGDRAVPVIGGKGAGMLEEALHLGAIVHTPLGEDLLIEGTVAKE